MIRHTAGCDRRGVGISWHTADAAVPGAAALPSAEVSEAVLHSDAFADERAVVARLGQLAEALLPEFTVGDGHGATVAWSGGRALVPQLAAIAGLRIELDVGTGIDRFDFPDDRWVH